MYVKFDFLNEKLEWHKKRSLSAYRATQNNSDTLAFILLKRKKMRKKKL